MTDTQQFTPDDDSPTTRAIQAVMNDARRPLEKRIAELEVELAERENDVPARITAELERDDARAEVARLTAELDEVTDLGRSALKTQELRDERTRAVTRWHDQKQRADKAEARLDQAYAETDRLRDAWQQAWAERNEARSILGATRRLVATWAGPTTAGERLLAGEILTLTGGPWTEPDNKEAKP